MIKNKSRYLTAVVITILLVSFSIALTNYRNVIFYHYYVFRLTNTVDVSTIESITDKLLAISPQLKEPMVKTYLNAATKHKVRTAIGMALVRSDRNYAEKFFYQQLASNNDQIIASAIINLDLMTSDTSYDRIYTLSSNKSPDVRFAVVSYIAKFKDPKSMQLLEASATSDNDPKVKEWAGYLLKRLKGEIQ